MMQIIAAIIVAIPMALVCLLIYGALGLFMRIFPPEDELTMLQREYAKWGLSDEEVAYMNTLLMEKMNENR